ncbi:MAG: ABC transporter ATP-binding protein [Pannonibacter phragmitetus]
MTASENQNEAVLKIEGLTVNFRTNTGMVEAVRGVDIHVNRGETVAIVGESGSGKSQTMMAAMGLLASNGITGGRVLYRDRNILGLKTGELNQVRGKKITMIFQEPMTSLDPLYTISRQLCEPMVENGGLSWAKARARALELLKLVNIPEPERKLKSYPYELSGGQRQRVMIAMALANDPDVLIADEPTTALDVTTQAQILDLLADLQKRLGMAVVFITHDLGIVRRIADRVYVMRKGQTLGIVGESGSGKSTLGRALLGLMPSDGRVFFNGTRISDKSKAQMRPLRKHMQLVFQDPFGSLSPRMTVGQIITEGLLVHEPGLSAAERDRRACQALEEVSLDPVMRNRYPHEFSGGQRQRIAIARAMVLKPDLMVLDEPTSALDRTIQKQIVTLLRDLQSAHGLTYLFISHDLAVVRAMSDTVMVMQHGKIVEAGPAADVFEAPREEYTRRLIAAAMLPTAHAAV